MAFASPRPSMLLSVAVVVETIVLKTAAWRLAGSVGLVGKRSEARQSRSGCNRERSAALNPVEPHGHDQ
jgi:hypothetical protein